MKNFWFGAWNTDQRGATLPMALLFIVLISIGAVATLGRLSAERRSTGNIQAEVDAYVLAQAGLAKYLASVKKPPGASFDTTITDFSGGSATVSVWRLRPASDSLPALYLIRAYGVDSAAIRFDATTPSAARSVAQFALWEPGSMKVLSAWTSLTGLRKTGGSGTISGVDECGMSPAVAGVAVPVMDEDGGPGYVQAGGTAVPTGVPPISYPAVDPAGFAAVLPLDWNAIINQGAIEFDYTLTGLTGWPVVFTNWPSIYVNNSTMLTLGSANSGRGLLVVRHDLTLTGNFSWDGIILVGGIMKSAGNETIRGTAITGLNLKLGESVPQSDMATGNKTFRYNSCNIKNSLANLGSLVGMPNARVDNWPGY